MYAVRAGSVCLPAIAAMTASGVARSIGLRPTTAAGACSQRPMHGAPMTRTPDPQALSSAACSASDPAIRHDSVSQTRTVSGGGGVSPSFTTSK